MSVVQGRNGSVTINSVAYPAYSWSVSSPRNIAAPNPIGNGWQTHFGEGGPRSSRIEVAFNLRRTSDECIDAAFWALWLTRAFSGNLDNTSAFTIALSDSQQVATLSNCKAESFVLAMRPGQQVSLRGIFLAPGIPSLGNATVSAYSPWDSSAPLMWDNTTFTGVTTQYGWDLSYANNHVPDAAHKAADKTLTAWDAGIRSCGLSVILPAYQGACPITDGEEVTIELVGATETASFVLAHCIPTDTESRGADVGQVFRTVPCLVQGGSGATDYPLVVTVA